MTSKQYEWICPHCNYQNKTPIIRRRNAALAECKNPGCQRRYRMSLSEFKEIPVIPSGKSLSITKQLLAIAYDLQSNAPTHVITRTWEDNGGKWKLVLIDGTVTLYHNDNPIKGTSAANHTTLVKMVASIREEANAAIAWTDELIKAECNTELNDMVSNVIVGEGELNTNMHQLFCQAMINRVRTLSNILGKMPRSEALDGTGVNFYRKFTSTDHGINVAISISRSGIATLNSDPELTNHNLLAAMLVYQNWGNISEFCAKVFTQLGKK